MGWGPSIKRTFPSGHASGAQDVISGRWPSRLCFPEPSGSAASRPRWSQLPPLPRQSPGQPAGGAPSHRGPAARPQMLNHVPKARAWRGATSFWTGQYFFQELIFLLNFLRASSSCPSFESLKNSLTPPPPPFSFLFFFGALILAPKTTLPNSVPKLTPCLPSRPALTPPLITVLGFPHAPNCHPGRAEPRLLLY